MSSNMNINNHCNYFCSIITKNRRLIILAFSIYLFSFVVGTMVFFTAEPIDSTPGAHTHQTSISILQEIMKNNTMLIIIMILGSFLLSLPTIFNLMSNGFLLGTLIAESLRCGLPIVNILAITIPHCLFELPAMWIAGAASFKITYEILCYLNGRKNHILNNEEINDFLILSGIALLLIIIAAFVEAYITHNLFRLLYLN